MSFSLFRASNSPSTYSAANHPVQERSENGDTSAGASPGLTGISGRACLATDFGPVPAMLLRKNDRVQTVDGDFVKVIAVRKVAFDAELLTSHPAHCVIRIRAGRLGSGMPRSDTDVAPDQLVRASLRTSAEGYLPARDYVGLPGVERAPVEETVYYCPVLATEAEVLVEGMRLKF